MKFAPEGSSLTSLDYTRLERFVTDEHSNFLRTFINYTQKSFITLGPGVDVIIYFFRKTDVPTINQEWAWQAFPALSNALLRPGVYPKVELRHSGRLQSYSQAFE